VSNVKNLKTIIVNVWYWLRNLFSGKRALIETTIVAMLISVILTQIMLPAFIPVLTDFLNTLPGIEAVNFLVWFATITQFLLMAVVNALFSMPNKYRASFLFSLSIKAAIISIFVISYSSYLYVQFTSDLLNSENLLTIALYYFYYPSLLVSLTNNVSGFWLFSSIIFAIIQIIMLIASVKK
jgi:hypothetical protein